MYLGHSISSARCVISQDLEHSRSWDFQHYSKYLPLFSTQRRSLSCHCRKALWYSNTGIPRSSEFTASSQPASTWWWEIAKSHTVPGRDCRQDGASLAHAALLSTKLWPLICDRMHCRAAARCAMLLRLAEVFTSLFYDVTIVTDVMCDKKRHHIIMYNRLNFDLVYKLHVSIKCL